MKVLDIQQALRARGFDPGPLDGIRGRRTIGAIEAFQRANGLAADGIVGPLTARVLFAGAPKGRAALSVNIPWLATAFDLIGTREIASHASEAAILGWASELDIAYAGDDIPWCGLFVAHCIGSQLLHEPLPTAPLWARAWSRFGNAVTPQPGAVMVFWRGSPAAGSGHVGFYVGEERGAAGAYHILGGNQSDKVCIIRIDKAKLLDARWPSTVPAASGKPNFVNASGGQLFNDAG